MAALKGIIKRGLRKLKSYKCEDCGAYHLSSFSDNRKPHGYRGKKRKQTFVKKKKNSNFIKIKVTEKELQEGICEKPKQVKLLGAIINLENK